VLVLHVDIDFFVDPIVYYRTDTGPRPSGREHRAEASDSVIHFAEKQCLLSTKRPIPGTAVVHNDEVFEALERHREDGVLEMPFEMVHVDAHADLGVGEYDFSFERITTDVLHRPIGERARGLRTGRGALGFGNWLAFCLACRWIDKLTFVRHHAAMDDLHQAYFSEYLVPRWQHPPERRELNIRMQPLTDDEFATRAWQRTGAWGRKLSMPIELPLIPATVVDRAAFQLERPPDLLLLCLSPGYSPPSADRILKLFKRYLKK
jgi:hypothetical protein